MKRLNDLYEDRLAYLDNLRAVAILMVVATHSISYCPMLSGYCAELISMVVHTISVPVFFLVDGYLFARTDRVSSRHDYLRYVIKSSGRLLIPWLIFLVGYSALRYLFEMTGYLSERVIVGQTADVILINSYGSVVAPQLYFLLSLYLIRLAAPMTRRLLAFDKKVTLLASLLFVLFYQSSVDLLTTYLHIPNGHEPITHALWGLQFYLVGINLFRFRNLLVSHYSFAVSFTLFCLASITLRNTGSVVFMEQIFQYAYLLSIFFAFKIFNWKNTLFSSIGQNTMGIYLIHAPVLLKASSVIINRFIKSPLTSFLVTIVVTFVASFALTLVIKKIPFGSLLFGQPTQKTILHRCNS